MFATYQQLYITLSGIFELKVNWVFLPARCVIQLGDILFKYQRYFNRRACVSALQKNRNMFRDFCLHSGTFHNVLCLSFLSNPELN